LRSKRIGIEGLSPACPVLLQCFVSQALKSVRRAGKRGLPAFIGLQLLEDGRGELVLISVGKARCGLKRLLQGLGLG
jgi:hypothetical protein